MRAILPQATSYSQSLLILVIWLWKDASSQPFPFTFNYNKTTNYLTMTKPLILHYYCINKLTCFSSDLILMCSKRILLQRF